MKEVKDENLDYVSTKEINNITKNYLDSLIFENEAEPVSNVLSIIESPFFDRKDNDILSSIFHKFYTATDIPIGIPVFSFLALISALCVKQKVTFCIPMNSKKYELATWVMCLAPSCSSKTLAMDKILDLVPMSIDGKKIIENNFEKPNGPAAFVQCLKDLPEGRGLWIQDEASQMFKSMETLGSPMAEIRESLLKIKDHKVITWKNKKETIQSEKIVLTQFFVNTIDSMARNISDESMKDGIIRRYTIADCQNIGDDRHFTDRALYNFDVLDEHLQDKMADVLLQDLHEKNFRFTTACHKIYQKMFKAFWERQYKNFMVGSENIYRTYMMESWKYAVFHHIIHQKEGDKIDEKSLEWGLKVVMYLLNSFQMFIKYRAKKGNTEVSVAVESNRLTKMIDFIKENEGKKGFGMRAFCRKFNLKKDEVCRHLKSIKVHNPKLKSKLFDEIK